MIQKWLSLFVVAVLMGLGAPSLRAQAPAPQTTPSVSNASSDEDDEDKPFKPYWENEFELSSSNQQAGQSTNSLSYTGTYHTTESGNFISGEVELSRQKVEGTASNLGVLTVEGGLGLGFFSPSLAVGFEGGDSALRQLDGTLTLGFQLWDPLSLDYVLGGSSGSHQGDVSQFYPSLSGLVKIDTTSWNTSLGLIFTPWDWWSISTTLGYERDDTYELQDIKHPDIKVAVNQADQIATLTLGLDFTLFKGFVLDLSPQAGQEYQPAGSVYSPLTGGLVNNSSPTTQNFVGGTVSVSYSFE